MKDPGAIEQFKNDYFAYTGTKARLAMADKARASQDESDITSASK